MRVPRRLRPRAAIQKTYELIMVGIRTKDARLCAECGEEFFPLMKALSRVGRGQFCSLSCATRFNRRRVTPSRSERFWTHVEPEPTSGCFIWMGARHPQGYGIFQDGGRARRAHRVSYEMAHGPIPEPLELDHLCRLTCCVNPRHLEAVTAQTNTLRSDNPAAQNAKKPTCPRGHVYDYVAPKTQSRQCRQCKRENKRLMRRSRRPEN